MTGAVERRPIVIVGSGPAGAATALALARRDPALASDVLILEKSEHPREKTCAGGLIPKTIRLLDRLGVDLASVSNVRVDSALVRTSYGTARVDDRDVCRVVRRASFDAALVTAAREAGVEVRERTRVRDVVRDGDRVRVVTDAGEVSCETIVGADGSGSLVRRRLVPGRSTIARAVMKDVPVSASGWDGHGAHRYEFDFRAVRQGVRGYAWAFPTLSDGVPHVNVGAYSLPPAPVGGLERAMNDTADAIGIDPTSVKPKPFPIRVWLPGTRIAADRALLVGDAAGVDALLGEGISFAIEYGLQAAGAILEGRRAGCSDFGAYQDAIDHGPLGRKLARLATAARHFYGPRWRMWFAAAHLSRRAQRVGLAWYNGAPGFDDVGRWGLAARLLRPGSAVAT